MTKFKRIIICLLVAIMVCTCFSGITLKDEKLTLAIKMTRAFWEQENGEGSAQKLEAYNIKGLDGEEDYILIENLEGGYAIYERENLQLIEYSAQSMSPYQNVTYGNKYYAGPGSYYKAVNKELLNLHTNKKISSDIAQKISSQMKQDLSVMWEEREAERLENEKLVVEDTSLANLEKGNTNDKSNVGGEGIPVDEYGIIEQKYIPNAYFFKNYHEREKNSAGTCTTVATQLLLAYNHFMVDSRLISNSQFIQYDNSMYHNTTENYTTREFYLMLLEQIDPWGYHAEQNMTYIGSDTEGASVFDAKCGIDYFIENHVDENLIYTNGEIDSTKLNYYYLYTNNETIANRIKYEIDNGYPTIVSMHTYNEETGGKENHGVVVYGYQDFSINNQRVEGFIADYGWQEHSYNLWFSKDWLNERILYFHLNTHNHNFVPYTEEDRDLYGHIEKCTICGVFGLRNSHYFETKELIEYEENGFVYKDSEYHNGKCLCGEKRLEMHNFEYVYKTEANHSKYCKDCEYQSIQDEPHVLKREGYCLLCGDLER